MRQFSILVVFVLAFGGAAVFYEKESRKVRGVLTQITALQAQLGDLQAEVNRLNAELKLVQRAEQGPNLKILASRIQNDERPPTESAPREGSEGASAASLIATDVTRAPTVIDSGRDDEVAEAWRRPTVDADQYNRQQEAGQELQRDPYL